jgi:hypothetical protein
VKLAAVKRKTCQSNKEDKSISNHFIAKYNLIKINYVDCENFSHFWDFSIKKIPEISICAFSSASEPGRYNLLKSGKSAEFVVRALPLVKF